MLNGLVLVLSLLASAVVLAMLFFTTPTEVGPFGVLVLFVMFYAVMFGLATLIVWLFSRIIAKKEKISRKGYLYAAILAFGPLLILVIKAAGTFNIAVSAILSAIVVLLGCFWVKKNA